MKRKEIKTIWKLAKYFWIGGFALWVVETIAFLLIEGWHLKATSKAEVFFDSCVGDIWKCALMLTIFVCYHGIACLNSPKKRNNSLSQIKANKTIK